MSDNQSPVFAGHNAFTGDPLLMLVASGVSAKAREQLALHGKWAGMPETLELARLANKMLPSLKTHDAKGNRIDQVEYHPAYHAFMRKSVSVGMHASSWEDNQEEKGQRNLARAARMFMTAGVEMGHLCPITMTNASVAALKASPDIAEEWLPLILSRKYDSTQKPPVSKSGVTFGMGMTERQGGTDVRLNTTKADPASEGIWRLNGQKWFMSAPMCDAFLVLAQTNHGLSCFLVPRLLSDGAPNGFHFQRLKDKLGNRSNASSEVEFHDSVAQMIGKPGEGIKTILEMVTMTRLDCSVASSGLMRAAVWEAVEHCRNRVVMGKKLIDQPLMQRVLADMALDVAAATALSFRLAQSFDRAVANPAEAHYKRLMTPVIKYWTTKIAPALIGEAMECMGGNGFVEEGNLARHYREAPLNSIWEGSGNVMCLDVLRVINKEPDALKSVLSSMERDLGGDSGSKTVDVIRSAATMAASDEGAARILTEQLAFTAAAAELRRIGLSELADAFTETRLGGLWRTSYGMLDTRQNAPGLIKTLYPEI